MWCSLGVIDMASKKILSTRNICFIGVFTAMIIVVSQLPPIPLAGGVPITLQTFIIPLSGAVLGAKLGALAALTYVLLGVVGLPVFAGFAGGLQIIAGPTGGFILSFPLMAFVAGLGAYNNRSVWMALALAAGSVINLSWGMLQFAFVTGSSLQTAFFVAVFPFILIEMGKMLGVFIIAPSMRKILVKNDFL